MLYIHHKNSWILNTAAGVRPLNKISHSLILSTLDAMPYFPQQKELQYTITKFDQSFLSRCENKTHKKRRIWTANHTHFVLYTVQRNIAVWTLNYIMPTATYLNIIVTHSLFFLFRREYSGCGDERFVYEVHKWCNCNGSIWNRVWLTKQPQKWVLWDGKRSYQYRRCQSINIFWLFI